MSIVLKLRDKIINGEDISREEALKLIDASLSELTREADYIRKHYCANRFDACTLINVKNGHCSEDCIFCAQSINYRTNIKSYPMLSEDELINQTKKIYDEGFKRISYVASGRKISDEEFQGLINAIKILVDEVDDIQLCVSLGLLTRQQIRRLNRYNVDRIHNNLESSEDFFRNICTTHTYNDKLDTLRKIIDEDVTVCSGGIFGLGESFEERIDLALKLRDLRIKSIPINILNPIESTPVEDYPILSNDEVCRIIAIFRFINPTAFIRMAGGRILLSDNGLKAFQSGANACIFGNMLTTSGVSVDDDLDMIKKLGYDITYSL